MAQRGKGWLDLGLGCLPLSAFFAFFYGIPVAYLMLSLDLSELVQSVGDPYVIKLTVDTAIQALASTIPSVILAIPLAYFFSEFSFKGSGILRNLLLTPFFIPAFAVTEGIIIMLGERGLVNQVLAALLGKPPPVLSVLYSMEAVILVHIFYYLPLAVVILGEGLSSVNQELLDAAKVSGAGWFLTFKTIYFNHLLPFVAASSLLIFAFSFITYSTPILIGGRFSTLEVEIYSTRTKSISSSLALIQLLITSIVSGTIMLLRERLYKRGATVGQKRRPRRLSFSTACEKALLVFATVIMAVELFPVYLVMAQSVSTSAVVLFPSTFSLENFSALLAAEFGFGMRFSDVLLQSLSIATVVSLVSICISIFIVWQSFEGESFRRVTSWLLSLPLSVSRSSLALGIMLAYGFGLLRLYGSWLLMVVGHVAIIVPLTARIIEASWFRISSDIKDAAELSGASRLFRLTRIELPIIAPAVAASFLLAFSSSISEFTFSNFFSTFNLMTLPISVAVLLDIRRLDLAAALNGVIIVIVMAAEAISSMASEDAMRVI